MLYAVIFVNAAFDLTPQKGRAAQKARAVPEIIVTDLLPKHKIRVRVSKAISDVVLVERTSTRSSLLVRRFLTGVIGQQIRNCHEEDGTGNSASIPGRNLKHERAKWFGLGAILGLWCLLNRRK